jgi:hypothetical protein
MIAHCELCTKDWWMNWFLAGSEAEAAFSVFFSRVVFLLHVSFFTPCLVFCSLFIGF